MATAENKAKNGGTAATGAENAKKEKGFASEPTGGNDLALELQGTWDPDRKLGDAYLPFQGVLVEGRKVQGNFGTSVLYVFKSTARCAALDEDGNAIELPAGSIVGVWEKGNLLALRKASNCELFLRFDKTKKVKRGDMTIFKVSVVRGTPGRPVMLTDLRPGALDPENDGRDLDVPFD